MNWDRYSTLVAGTTLAASLWLLGGCNEPGARSNSVNGTSDRPYASSARSPAPGARIAVSLGSTLTSETANVGDAWHGSTTEDVPTPDGGIIPAGSPADGVVASATPARKGSRARLELELRGIQANGRDQSVHANAEPVIAGSPRARNLGAIAGGAAAGALIGKVVGDGRNAAVGAVAGGAVATGVVAGTKGYQVVLRAGTVMNFTVGQPVAMR